MWPSNIPIGWNKRRNFRTNKENPKWNNKKTHTIKIKRKNKKRISYVIIIILITLYQPQAQSGKLHNKIWIWGKSISCHVLWELCMGFTICTAIKQYFEIDRTRTMYKRGKGRTSARAHTHAQHCGYTVACNNTSSYLKYHYTEQQNYME